MTSQNKKLTYNIITNYISQIYVSIMGFILLPLYLKHMGAEAYGLVGFFAMMQAWFNILDLGLTPTVSREMARYKGGSVSALQFRQLYRALMLVFFIIATLGGGGIYISSPFIVHEWLEIGSLPDNAVLTCIQLMAVIISLRWMSGLYRGVITGSEQIVWLSGYNALFATIRFAGVFIVMWQLDFDILVFFYYQLSVSIIEFLVLVSKASLTVPKLDDERTSIGWSITPVKRVLRFSLAIAFTSSVWVLVTQTDKLVLSGILPIDEYGYFTLAVLIANSITVISGPVSNAILPRMSRLYAENNLELMLDVYRRSTQIICVIAGSVAVTLVSVAEPLLLAWSGEPSLASKAAPLLQLYASGNAFLCVGAFAYYLQYAKGNLKYHLIGNIILMIVLVPSIVFFARSFGAIGAGYVWLITNALYLMVWVSFVHVKLVPGLHRKWLIHDVLTIMGPISILGYCISALTQVSTSILVNIITVLGASVAILITAILFSSFTRAFISRKIFTNRSY